MIRRLVAIACVLGASAGAANAYPTGFQFDSDPVSEDGAGGVVFTGAPRWAGHDCSVCHTDGPRRVGVTLEAEPADLFDNGYQPGAVYKMRVVLQNNLTAIEFAQLGDNCGPQFQPYNRCDDNGFALEIDDANGQPMSGLAGTDANGGCTGKAAPGGDVAVVAGGSAVAHSGIHHGQGAWVFCWTAPGTGSGRLTAFISAVDGNGGDGTPAYPNDMTGDDTVTGAVPLLERGATPPMPQTGGCNAGGGAGSLALLAAIGLLALAWRRRRAAARVAALLAVVAAFSGCATVHPWEREKLAQKKMTFEPDPHEDELDLHMQESREGSAGGYGSAGGGCGCN